MSLKKLATLLTLLFFELVIYSVEYQGTFMLTLRFYDNLCLLICCILAEMKLGFSLIWNVH